MHDVTIIRDVLITIDSLQRILDAGARFRSAAKRCNTTCVAPGEILDALAVLRAEGYLVQDAQASVELRACTASAVDAAAHGLATHRLNDSGRALLLDLFYPGVWHAIRGRTGGMAVPLSVLRAMAEQEWRRLLGVVG